MDLDIIVIDRIDIGVYTIEKQTEATIDIYSIVNKILEERKKNN